MKNWLFTLVFICLNSSAFCQLAGVYTIGGSSPDFPSVAKAVDTLNQKGVRGAVTFHVRSGTYSEQIYLKKIAGISAKDSILFIADPNATTMPQISYTPSGSSDNFTFRMHDVQYVTFRNIHFNSGGSTHSWVLYLSGNTQYLAFDSCLITGAKVVSTTGNNSVIVNGSGARDSIQYCTFRNSVIRNGSYAFDMSGNPSYYEKGNRIENCRILNYSYYGIKAFYQSQFSCIGNVLHDTSATSDSYGIRVRFARDQTFVNANTIISNAVQSAYVLDFGPMENNDSTAPSVLSNNFCVINASNISKYASGLQIGTCLNLVVGHNSILINARVPSSGQGRAFNFDASASGANGRVKVYNNCVVNKGNGMAVSVESSAVGSGMISEMDHNNYFTNGSIFGGYNTNESSFEGWQKSSGFDANGLNVDPEYVSTTDLHTTRLDLNRAGKYLALINTDIDGEKRNSSAPDIGADEFHVSQNDLAIEQVLTQNTPSCASADSYVEVLIHNRGEATQQNFPLAVVPNGGSMARDTFRSSLRSNEKAYFKIFGFDSRIGTSIPVKVFTDLASDADRSNDTVQTTLTVIPQIKDPKPIHDTVCRNGIAEFSAIGGIGQEFIWYETDTSATPLNSADRFFINKIQRDTQIWVVARQRAYEDSLFVSFEPQNGCKGGIMFDLKPFRNMVLQGFTTLFNRTGPHWVAVYYRKGSHKGHETSPSDWVYLDSMQITAASTSTLIPLKFDLDLLLEADSIYGIYIKGDIQFWEISGTTANTHLEYSAGSGLCADFGQTIPNRVMNGRILYERDLPCESNRVPIKAKVLEIPKVDLGKDTSFCKGDTFSLKLDAGPGYQFYQWNNGAKTRFTTLTKPGLYEVQVIDSNRCLGFDQFRILEDTIPVVILPEDTSICENAFWGFDVFAPLGYQYKWSDKANTYTTHMNNFGTLSVTITDSKGCVAGDSFTVHRLDPPNIDLGDDLHYCMGETFGRRLSAGSGFKYYYWNTGRQDSFILVFGKGMYTVEVENDLGCISKDTVFVIENPLPQPDLGGDSTFCENSGINIELHAGFGFTEYFWSNGASSESIQATQAGTYSITVTDANSCWGSDTVELKLVPNPVVDLGADIVLDPSEVVNEVLDAGAGFTSYTWQDGSKTRSYAARDTGRFSVTVTDGNGCQGSDSIQIRFWNVNAVSELARDDIQINPNPGRDLVYLKAMADLHHQIRITTVNGQLIRDWFSPDRYGMIDVSALDPGFYVFFVREETGYKALKWLKVSN
ncbi:MAG: hypothetical protein H6606_06170 [Flavobacteriales bacterium]|nr:hypothetical protein [Flavobacteriales bacterium]